MPSLKYSPVLFSLIAITLLSLTCEAAPTYTTHYCSNSTFFTANDTYQSNLNLVLSSLSSNATQTSSGFYNASAGEDPPDVAYGLFLCRGDVNTTLCHDCVAAATTEILRRCPLDKVALIWYDECFLRYSNQSIFATVNVVPGISLINTQNILEAESDRFNQLLANAMNSLATRAANSQSGKKFATEEDEFTSSQTLYSLVQCTPDLTVSDCNTCLRSAIGGLPSCCNGKQGARLLLPSCNLRYELYPFFNGSNRSIIPGPPAPGTAKKDPDSQ